MSNNPPTGTTCTTTDNRFGGRFGGDFMIGQEKGFAAGIGFSTSFNQGINLHSSEPVEASTPFITDATLKFRTYQIMGKIELPLHSDKFKIAGGAGSELWNLREDANGSATSGSSTFTQRERREENGWGPAFEVGLIIKICGICRVDLTYHLHRYRKLSVFGSSNGSSSSSDTESDINQLNHQFVVSFEIIPKSWGQKK